MDDLRAELAEWQDKCSDLSQNADPGQREDSIIYLQGRIIASLEAELAELKGRHEEELEWLMDTLDFNLQQSGFAAKELARWRAAREEADDE